MSLYCSLFLQYLIDRDPTEGVLVDNYVVVDVVVVLLLLSTISNRLQPNVIQAKRSHAITTETCCMGPV